MATPKIQIDLEASAGLSGLRAVGKELEGVTAKAKEAAKELQNVTSAASGQGDGQSWRTKTGEDAKNSYYKAGNVTYSVQKMSDVMNWYKDQGEPATTEQSSGLSSEDASQLEKDTTEFNQSFEKVQKKGIFRKLADTFKHMAEEFNEGRKEAREEWAAKRAASGSGSASASGSGKGENSAGGMAAAKKSSEELNKSLQKTNATMKKAGETSSKSSTAFKHLGNAAKAAAKGVKALTSACAVVAGVVSGLIAVVAGLAVALAGPAAILAKFNERMGEAQKYRLALGDLGNEQKRLENKMKILGYESEELRSQWLDLQIQLEKLHWENQYLTEDDIKIEEGIKNLKLAIGSITGTMVDWIGTMISDLFPTLDDLQSWLLDSVSPAIASVATLFTHWSDVTEVAFTSIEISAYKMADELTYFFTEYIPEAIKYFATNAPAILKEMGTNILKLFENIGSNIFAAIQSIGDFVYDLLPKSWQDAFSDIRTMFDNFLHNLGEFAGAVIKYFFDIPKKMGTFAHNFIQIFKNLFSKIGELFQKFAEKFTWKNLWESIKNGKIPDFTSVFSEVNWGDLTTKGMKTDTTGGFGEYAHYRNITEGIESDEARQKKREERAKNRWKFTGLTEGMEWSAWDGFKAPEKRASEWTTDAEKRLQAAMERVNAGYTQNLATTQAFMRKNFRKEGERLGDNAVRPIGPAEMLKLLEGSTKAQTEGLTSAYDRINNAVSNKNPMVDLLKKQIEAQKQAAEQQKKANEKQAEAAEKQTEHNSVVEEKVVGIYNWLTTGNAKSPSPAAVVEG